jgi:hypothetical protein
MSDDHDDLDMTPDDWAALEADLAELERTDPSVEHAAENLRRAVERILRDQGLEP